MDKLTDFYEQMIADLPSQFKGKARIEGLIYALARQMNAVRDLYAELNEMRSLKTAVGKQLDGIGDIAVLTRAEATQLAVKSSAFKQMTDDIYRLYLIQKIMANMANCTYQDIYDAMIILWGRTPVWYSESIDEPATITMTVPALSSFDDTATFLGLWEIRPAGVQLHFTATASETILINADFRPSAFIISHAKTGTKPRWATVLTFEGIILDELLSTVTFTVKHHQTSENLHSGTKPSRIILLDIDGVVIAESVDNADYTLTHDKAGTKPHEAVVVRMEGVQIQGVGETTKFKVEPPQTSEGLHTGTNPSNVLVLDEATAKVIETLGKEVFDIEFVRSGTEPSNAVVVDIVSADVQQNLDKEVYGIEFTRSGTEPQPSVFGETDTAGIATGITPASFSVKYRKCGTGVTKS